MTCQTSTNINIDNLVNRRVLKKQLGRLGFPIYEAGDGIEALEFLEQTKYWTGKEESGKDLAVVCCDWEVRSSHRAK